MVADSLRPSAAPISGERIPCARRLDGIAWKVEVSTGGPCAPQVGYRPPHRLSMPRWAWLFLEYGTRCSPTTSARGVHPHGAPGAGRPGYLGGSGLGRRHSGYAAVLLQSRCHQPVDIYHLRRGDDCCDGPGGRDVHYRWGAMADTFGTIPPPARRRRVGILRQGHRRDRSQWRRSGASLGDAPAIAPHQ